MAADTAPQERGEIMPRVRLSGPGASRATVVASVIAVLLAAAVLVAQKPAAPAAAAARAGTLQRVRDLGKIRLGFRTDARPFSYEDDSGRPAGYSVTLCQSIADAVRAEPDLGAVAVDWVPVTADDRFQALQQGRVDLLCGGETVTLARRAQASFSLPIFPGGVGALVRSDAPARLREVLSGRTQVFHPVWRAAATRALQSRAFSAVQGTTAEKWLTERIADLQVLTTVERVSGYDAGVQALLDRRVDALFGERAVLADAARSHRSARDLIVIDRLFTYEPLALALGRGDDEFRLLVDRTLSREYGSGNMAALYSKWFGEPDETALTFFRWNTLSE
jgi:ABC-type amino acid transport substrate-binding protein